MKHATQYEADYYLFDTPGTDFKGGSGKTFDWALLKNAGIPADKVILSGWFECGKCRGSNSACEAVYGRCFEWRGE